MSQPVRCKGDGSHPSWMTCWKPKRKEKREEEKDRRAWLIAAEKGEIIILALPTSFYPPPYSLAAPVR